MRLAPVTTEHLNLASAQCAAASSVSPDVLGWLHPAMQHADDLDQRWRIGAASKIDHVALLRITVESFNEIGPGLPQGGVLAEPKETGDQGINVPIGLIEAPLLGGIVPDLGEIRLRASR